MKLQGLDRSHHLRLEMVPFATKTAAETALWGGSVDVVVNDWVSVSRLRGQGAPVQAVDAFSQAIGGIVVRNSGPIRTVGDLRGRKIGVVSLSDKSFLVLRAFAVERHGFDPQQASEVISAAPPLLSRLLQRGDVDAIVQYWQFMPGLVRTGEYRELASVVDLLQQMWPAVQMPFLVVVATDRAVQEKAPEVRAFLRALREAKQALAERQELWNDLFEKGTLGIDDRTLLDGLRQRYRAGLPGPWNDVTVRGLMELTERLARVAGEETVGALALNPTAFNVALATAR